MTVTVDGREVYAGSFMAGFARQLELDPGEHRVEGEIGPGLVKRRRSWALSVPALTDEGEAPRLDVCITYSRTWGNLGKELLVQQVRELPPLVDPEADGAARRIVHPIRATWALLCTLTAVFAAEILFGVTPRNALTPSIETLVGLGGLVTPVVAEGQWYRVISCTYLHGNPIHLLCNGVALYMVGVLLEGLLGWRWLLALYLVGALGGSALSLALNDGSLVSVGASGAVMGLFAAGLFVVQSMSKAERGAIRARLLRVLVPSMLPLVPVGGGRVDVGAHIGGALAGAAAGYLIMRALSRRAPDDEGIVRLPAARALSVLFLVASAAAAAAVGLVSYPRATAAAALHGGLLPPDELPEEGPPTDGQISEWLVAYPGDPQVRLLAAEVAIRQGRWDDVDRHVAAFRERFPQVHQAYSPDVHERFPLWADEIVADAALRRQLLPSDLLPRGTDEEMIAIWVANGAEWLERYPNDPRLRFLAGNAALVEGDVAAAVEHAREGLRVAPRFATLFPDGIRVVPPLHAVLARANAGLGREGESQRTFRAACAGELGDEVREYFTEEHLCAAAATTQ